MDKTEQPMINPDAAIFPISVIADILEVHQRTLRIYDDENILVPSRSSRNRRLYSFNDLEKGKFIKHLTRNLGVNLAGVKIALVLLKEAGLSPESYTEKVNDIVAQYKVENL